MGNFENKLPRRFNNVFNLLGGLEQGSLEIELPDTQLFSIKGQTNGPNANIKIIKVVSFELAASGGLSYKKQGVVNVNHSIDMNTPIYPNIILFYS